MKKIRIWGGPAAHQTHIELDGFEISAMVQAVTLKSDVRTGDIITVQLSLVGEAEVDLLLPRKKRTRSK